MRNCLLCIPPSNDMAGDGNPDNLIRRLMVSAFWMDGPQSPQQRANVVTILPALDILLPIKGAININGVICLAQSDGVDSYWTLIEYHLSEY